MRAEPLFSPDDIAIVLGTRPEAIKLLGLVQLLGPRARLIHTGQHYDATMWANVIEDLPGMEIDHHVTMGGLTRGEQIGYGTSALTQHLLSHPARALVVQGDTNSTLAGALAASSVGIPVVHVEAGLRSHDRSMPEEINRILVDAVADLCCAPTTENALQLGREGVSRFRIAVTGNTLSEAINMLLPAQAERAAIQSSYGLAADDYVLATLHRASNVDDPTTLAALLAGLAQLARRTQVVLPLHPRTQAAAERFGLMPLLADLCVLEPLSPRHFLSLEAGATLLLSDSGGVQEEAALLRRPLVVLRDSTERPELLDGWCRLLGEADPADELCRALDDVVSWTRELSDRAPAYAGGDPSRLIMDEMDRRWPASRTAVRERGGVAVAAP